MGEGDKQKIAAKAVKARLKEIGKDPLYADERAALEAYADPTQGSGKSIVMPGSPGRA